MQDARGPGPSLGSHGGALAEGGEHANGWRESFEAGGRWFTVEARHHYHPRPPRPHEAVRAAAFGCPPSAVEVARYEWVVIAGRRIVGTLRRGPAGGLHDGRRGYGRGTAAGAARELAAALAAPGNQKS